MATGTDLPSPVAPGDVIDGKYTVDRVLGAGGMGVVVAAIHAELGSTVAIKLVRAEVARNPQIVARFQREARIAARLKSDHVVRVMDVGTHPPGPSGAPYMVLEMLDGTDLAVVLAQRGPLPVDEAVTFVVQACEAVEEAHALGIVHRDLKPANLFVTTRRKGPPIVKVLDFGISSMAAGDHDARLTSTGSVMGTPLYMAPEQMIDARDADQRSDIWALGAILYELLTGGPPFPGNTFGAVHARVLGTEAASISARRPDVPAELDAVVLRCLRKLAEERFQTVANLEAALRPFMEARSALALAPAAEPEVVVPRHTTQVLGVGAESRRHTTQMLDEQALGVAPQPATNAAWDQKTTLAQPPSSRSNVGAAVVGVSWCSEPAQRLSP